MVVARGQDVPGDARDRGAYPLPSDVDSDDPTRHRIELVQERARPALAAGPADLSDEVGFEQPGQRQRDRRLGQSADPSDLCTRERTLAMDQVQHGAFVDRPQQTWRADGDWRRAAQDSLMRSASGCGRDGIHRLEEFLTGNLNTPGARVKKP